MGTFLSHDTINILWEVTLDIVYPMGANGDRDELSAVAEDVDLLGSGWIRGPRWPIHLGDYTISFIRLV